MGMEKIVADAGKWVWDEFADKAKPGFMAFLNRKWDDAKENFEKIRYADEKWKDYNWGKAAERYKRHMQEVYGYVRVIGATEPIPINDVFTDVYILKKPEASSRFDMTNLQEIQKDFGYLSDKNRIRGLKIIVQKQAKRLYILGKPGAGKTTFLKYLVHQTILANELNKLPIFITLRDWNANKITLLDFIAKQFTICNFPDAIPYIEYLLESGRCIVLFDGLDEVPYEDGQREETIKALHDFSNIFLNSQMVITCRIAANSYYFSKFTYIEMADFSEAQVKVYAQNWFRDSAHTAKEFIKELNLQKNKGMRDLSRSPLLLSMICLAYDETLTIPNRRAELYEEALDALLKKWDASRKIKRDHIYQRLSLGHKRQLFARLAAEYFEKGEIFFPKKELARNIETFFKNLPPDTENEELDGETILETISAQHGILVERAKGLYSFSHLTFQEYYTAKYIDETANQGSLEGLITHLYDPRWHEVFLLTASLSYEASPMFTAMQKELQNILGKQFQYSAIQAWAIKRAKLTQSFSDNSKRALYWYFGLFLAPALGRDLVYSKDLARHIEIKDMPISADNLPKAIKLAHHLSSSRSLGQTRDQDLARDQALELINSLDPNLSNTLNSDHTPKNNLSRDYINSIGYFLLELNTINIIIFSNILSILGKNERTQEIVKKYNSFLSFWISNWRLGKKLLNCPSSKASEREWKLFYDKVIDVAEKILYIDLKKPWISTSFEHVEKYIRLNQLFWDCLQVARVENRGAIEDMILKAPDDSE